MKPDHTYATARETMRRLAAFGVLVVIVVMSTSALLRLRAAGLGCPDWPSCYGQPQAQAAGAERSIPRFLHRISAMAATAAAIGIAVFAASRPRRFRRELALSAAMFVLLVGLAVLGRASSTARLPAVPLGNVVGAMLLTSLFAWIALPSPRTGWPTPTWLIAVSWTALLTAFLQIALGVMTSASHSGLLCAGLLDCGPGAFSQPWSAVQFDPWREAQPSVAVHAAHRIGALAVAVMALLLAWGLRHRSRTRAAMLVATLLLQGMVGAGLVMLALPLELAILHSAAAALLLIGLVAAHHSILESRKETQRLI